MKSYELIIIFMMVLFHVISLGPWMQSWIFSPFSNFSNTSLNRLQGQIYKPSALCCKKI